MVRLDGAWWKYTRGYDQLGLLKGELEPYLKSQPVELRHEHDSETGDEVIRFHVTERPKAMWAVQLGEIIHDVHSALDHAIWQLVIDAGNTPREHVTGFPIFCDEGRFMQRGLTMIEGVPEDALAFIREAQPYNAPKHGEKPDHMALAVLRELWNIDKHRLLHLMTLGATADELGINVDARLEEIHIGSRFLKDGAEVVRFRPVGGTAGKVKVNMHATAEVTLDESMPDWVCQNGVMDVIVKIGQEAQAILKALSTFALDRPGNS